jgi:hypothetical protein
MPAYEPSQDEILQNDIAATNAADDQEKGATFYENVKKSLIGATGADVSKPHPWLDTFFDMPKNVAVGAYKAGVATLDTVADATVDLGNTALKGMIAGSHDGGDNGNEAPGVPEIPTLSQSHPELMKNVYDIGSQIDKHETTSDELVQGVAQFTTPFLAWMKAFNVAKVAATIPKLAAGGAAEAVTSGTAYMPHDARQADLLKRGTEMDGKFGDLLRTIAPDDSLVNHYLNYMTSRDGVTPDEKRNGIKEGEWEGRFKNAVDNTVTSAAIAGFLKSAAVSYKGARYSLEGLSGSADGSNRIGANAQRGMVAFHGTPHDFEAFDLSKLGTGEGNQSYGHGLYFAESKDVAGHYKTALSRRGVTPGSPLDHAMTAVEQHNGNARDAYMALRNQADKTRDEEYSNVLRAAAEKVKAGHIKRLGKLMTVEIPDEVANKMLDFDKTLKEQPDVLAKIPEQDRTALEAYVEEHNMTPDLGEYTGNQLQQMVGKAIGEDRIVFNPPDGDFSNPKKLAAEYFKANDIPGIRYLDGNSRGKASGTRNLVLFDDKHVKITNKE